MSTTRTQPSSLKPLDFDGSGRNGDFWADVPGGSAETRPALASRPAGPRKAADPLHHVKRLLRGRWPLLVGLSAAGGVLGVVAGYTASSPVYKSTGVITVNPSRPGARKTLSAADDAYIGFMRNERTRIDDNPAVAREAMSSPIWQETQLEFSPTQFSNFLRAERNDGDYTIEAIFTHPSPKIAYAGVMAALEGYERDFYKRRELLDAGVGNARQTTLSQLQADYATEEDAVRQLALGYEGAENLDELYERLRVSLDQNQRTLTALERDLRRGEARKALANELTSEDLAEVDETLRIMLSLRRDLLGEQQTAGRDLGEKSPTMRRLAQQLSDLDARIQSRGEIVRQNYFGTIPNLDDGGVEPVRVTTDYLAQLRARIAEITPKVEFQGKELQLVAADREELNTRARRRSTLREEIAAIEQQIELDRRDAMVTEALEANDIGWIGITYPDEGAAVIASDGRAATALGGGIMGAGIPAGLVLLLGLLDKRTRYSDDANDLADGLAGGPDGGPVPMLGVLPDLPDRLSDPRQASIAAHCVHQIRTILQIHHAVPLAGAEEEGVEEPRAFAVTSGGPGDGKTSLALALGLSYAASGCRTLLVDTDLRGGGLSKRLDVTGDEGVLDAIVGGDLLDVTCETEVPNLAVLPIGNARGSKAGVFSPNAVRRLVRSAKQHFDVILLDCGPVLGSIEATPVASAADASILVVSRNQAKPTIAKAAQHLQHVGATVAGVVFNRAGSADFEKSVAGMNYRVADREPAAAASSTPAKARRAIPAAKPAPTGKPRR